MSITTLLGYMIGRRKAILDIAAAPGATWLGLLFVMSAGFAREYDGEDLLAAPWHLLLPLGVSLVLSLVLFGVLVIPAGWRRGAVKGNFWGHYAVLLRLFWMTAPLAWLYAIPFERFCSAAEATEANLWILGIVSLWRVLLMARVVSVVYGANLVATAMLVLLFADTVALTALRLAPLPVVSIMGGIRLSESEQIIQATAFLVVFFGGVSWPIWALGTIVVLVRRLPRWRFVVDEEGVELQVVSRSLWVLAVLAIVGWLPVLFVTQPEQQLRRQVERGLRGGEIRESLLRMSEHVREEFPPHWEPPPRIGYGERSPKMDDVLLEMTTANVAPWVRTIFIDKMLRQLEGWEPWSHTAWNSPQRDMNRYLTLLEKLGELPSGPELVRADAERLKYVIREGECTPQQIERIRALFAAAGVEEDGTEISSNG